MGIARLGALGYAVYSAERDPHSPRRLTLMWELRRAIEAEELVLHYQPKIDMRTARTVGVEALVRWQHPRLGLLPPNEFIGLAEQGGLIRPLTRWVLNEAVRQCRALRR